jgi:hypothetical protein
LVIARYTHDTHGRGRAFAFSFFVILVFFCSFYLSAFEKEGWKEKSHVGYVIGHMDSEVLYEVMNRSWSGGEGVGGGRGCVVHLDTLERGADRGREKERKRERENG